MVGTRRGRTAGHSSPIKTRSPTKSSSPVAPAVAPAPLTEEGKRRIEKELVDSISRRRAALEAVNKRITPLKHRGIFTEPSPPSSTPSGPEPSRSASPTTVTASPTRPRLPSLAPWLWITACSAALLQPMRRWLIALWAFLRSWPYILGRLCPWRYMLLLCSFLSLLYISCNSGAHWPMQRNAGALASPVVQHVLSNGNTESNLWGLAEVIQEARQMEHTSWTKHLSSRAIVSPQSVDRVLHLLRMLASEAELNPRNLLFQTGLATVVVDHLTGSIVVAVRDTGPLVLSSQLKRTSFHGLAQTDLVELSEQLMAQLGGVLDKLMQGPYREKHLVVMGSGKSGAIAELLTLSLIERQNQELGWLSKGFLSGTVIKCFAFGAPPVMGVQADVPEKARAAISHWMLRGDAVASSSLHAADLLECVIYSREKSSLSEATELCSTEGRVTSIHHPLHVGRVLLLAQRHNEEHVLLMSPDHVAYVANHEMWHLQRENIRTAADYFEALGRVRVLEP